MMLAAHSAIPTASCTSSGVASENMRTSNVSATVTSVTRVERPYVEAMDAALVLLDAEVAIASAAVRSGIARDL
jgi:hypothetical protein